MHGVRTLGDCSGDAEPGDAVETLTFKVKVKKSQNAVPSPGLGQPPPPLSDCRNSTLPSGKALPGRGRPSPSGQHATALSCVGRRLSGQKTPSAGVAEELQVSPAVNVLPSCNRV